MECMKDSPPVNHERFMAMVKVAAELLGEEDSITKALREALTDPHPDAIKRGVALIRALPIAQRDHIFGESKRRLDEEAKFYKQLMEMTGTPTDIPPGETKH